MAQTLFTQRTEEEIFRELKEHPGAYRIYQGWNDELRNRFMDFCIGKKTLPILYDTVFKKLMNPDTHPERLEDCISCLLKQRVTIQTVLPTEDILMDGESTMVMDILVKLENGAYVLVEIQKIPYYFPAERASCYSADVLLRQYSRLKTEKGKSFSYKDLRKVYTIIFYEKSIEAFKAYHEIFTHHASMVCDSGLELNFLQEFYLVALDVFKKSEYSKHRAPTNHLVGWLSFFCTENTEEAETLCQTYPWLRELYAEMAQFGRKPEELMTMFSEMLREMDRNTIRYMVDDMKEQIEKGKVEYAELQEKMAAAQDQLTETEGKLSETEDKLSETEDKLSEAEDKLSETEGKLSETEGKLSETEGKLSETEGKLSVANEALASKDAEIARLKALLETK